jgi:hypothetical protein
MLRGEAGELVGEDPQEKEFRVTKARLEPRLATAIKAYLKDKGFDVDRDPPDAPVTGEYSYEGINRPEPPPEFPVTFRPRNAGEEINVEVRSMRGNNLFWERSISGPIEKLLPGGYYRVVVTSEEGHTSEVELTVVNRSECIVGRYR